MALLLYDSAKRTRIWRFQIAFLLLHLVLELPDFASSLRVCSSVSKLFLVADLKFGETF